MTNYVARAQVVVGLFGNTIKNPESWKTPAIDIPKDIEKVQLYWQIFITSKVIVYNFL